MKIKTLIAWLATGLLILGKPTRAAADPAIASSHRASFEYKHHVSKAHRSATLSQKNVSGVIPRAVRGGQPLQMLNPLAPAQYGTAEENVLVDPDVPGQGDGIKLFSISF
jgi:hypothetical protein